MIPTTCVAGVIHREDGALLCIKRSKEPEIGRWTLPGGHIEGGETGKQAIIREVCEETHLACLSAEFLGIYEYITPKCHLVILIYDCKCDQRLAAPGDDADDVAWFRWEELSSIAKTDGLFERVAALRDGTDCSGERAHKEKYRVNSEGSL